ncbi:hypothetical protein GWK47_036848 [Chionoecetes opilio]|uniref:Uncharacterized protein n=1 Tax=Chionoecetes opilio TaxID=41210 RepID=A0A8J4YNI5_CHIOP|nr:hypothetical protein GWK47_036848 [Chionoecetes opilio]
MSCAASHTRRLDSIQRRALHWWMLQTPRPTSPVRAGESSRLTGTRSGCRGACGIPKAQVQGCHTWLGYDSLREFATRSTRTVLTSGDAGRCRVPVPANTNAPCGPRLSRMWNIFTARVSSHPGDEHTKCKNWRPIGETLKPTR